MANNNKIENEEWIKSIKDSLSDYSVSPQEGGWERINASLSTTRTTRLNSYKKLILTTLSSAAAILALFLLLSRETNTLDQNEFTNFQANKTIANNTPTEILPKEIEPKEIEPTKQVPQQQVKTQYISNIIELDNVDTTGTTIDENNTDITENVAAKDSNLKSNNIKEKDADNRMTWEEYLKEEAKIKVVKKKDVKKTFIALAAGSNSFSGSNNKGIGNLNYNTTEKFYSQIVSAYYTPYAEYSHNQPLNFTIYIGKQIYKNLYLETGLSYTLMTSKIRGLKLSDTDVKQTLNYLGIPLRLNWNFINKQRYSVYASGGGFIEKCIFGAIDGEKIDIKKWQGGVNFNVGGQFKFTPNIALYLEPGLSYYIDMPENGSIGKMNNGLDIKNIRAEHPLGFSLSAGFRFSF